MIFDIDFFFSLCYYAVMKIGISTATFFPELLTEEALLKIEELGAPVAEVFLSSFYEYRPEFAKSLKAKLGNLQINSVHAMPLNFECNFFNQSRRVRGDGYYWLDQVARSAQLLNCKNYTFHGFARAESGKDDLGFIAQMISEVYSFTASYGVNMCIENTAHYAFNRPEFFKAIRESCPSIYGVFDIKQARRSGYPYSMYLKAMEGAIAYVHISDVNEKGKTCLPGCGVTDYLTLFKRLKDCGFDGNVLIENYRGDFNNFEEVKRSMDFLAEIDYKLK